jgi:hypothetical protein
MVCHVHSGMGKAWRIDFHIFLAGGGRIFSEVESCTYRMWNAVFISIHLLTRKLSAVKQAVRRRRWATKNSSRRQTTGCAGIIHLQYIEISNFQMNAQTIIFTLCYSETGDFNIINMHFVLPCQKQKNTFFE